MIGDGRVMYLLAQASSVFVGEQAADEGREGKTVEPVASHNDGVAVVAFSPSSKFEVVHSVRLWRALDPRNIAVFKKAGTIAGGKMVAA